MNMNSMIHMGKEHAVLLAILIVGLTLLLVCALSLAPHLAELVVRPATTMFALKAAPSM